MRTAGTNITTQPLQKTDTIDTRTYGTHNHRDLLQLLWNDDVSMQPRQLWQQADLLLREGRAGAAKAFYERLLTFPNWRLPAHLRLADLALRQQQVRLAVSHALSAYAVREPEPMLNESLCDVLMRTGELELAVQCLAMTGMEGCTDATIWASLGRMASEQSLPQHALPLLLRAQELGLQAPELDYLLGQANLYQGNAVEAERLLERCIVRNPQFGPAHRSLAKLRKQHSDSNHVERLRQTLGRMGEQHPQSPQLFYALFKEQDDLGDREAAWQALARGMQLRRAQLHYDSQADAQLFAKLIEMDMKGTVIAAEMSGPVPIFIVGMPRSGTTLLERILGAHSEVKDAGELSDFTCQMRWMCDQFGPPMLDLALVKKANDLDWQQLGQRYLQHTQWHAAGKSFYTDKLPANFLNVGFIAKALPQAKILHMVRDPMDVCFSNLKELFAMGYPHSYDQAEMADHYIRYRKLMAHWHKELPGRILDVDYAELVTMPETVARRVLSFCGLSWQDGVVDIQNRTSAVSTASSVQVREPIHRRFLAQWQPYATHLNVLQERLGAAGLLA